MGRSELPEGLDWVTLYDSGQVENLPWFIPGLDPDIASEVSSVRAGSKVLDLGTGPGTQAIALAKLGFDVTGTDISPGAIARAQDRAVAEGAQVRFVVDNILRSELKARFDLIVDRGCMHVLPIEKRTVYRDTIARLIKSGGTLLLKCFCPAETRPGGPHRVSVDEMNDLLAKDFEEITIRESEYQGRIVPAPRAYFVSARRKIVSMTRPLAS